MLKKIVFLIAISFCYQTTDAQSSFNNRYDVYGKNDLASGIVITDTNYFVLSKSVDSTNLWRICLQSIDTNGNLIFSKTLVKSNWYYYNGFASLIKTSDNKLAFSGAIYDTAVYLGLLVKYNEYGDTIWTKTYGDSVNWYTAYQCKQTQDGGFIIVGAMDDGTSTQALLIKTDSLGNKQWEQNYGGSGEEYGFSIELGNNNSYVIGGFTTSLGNGNIDSWVFKTDSLGNMQWQKTYGGIYEDGTAFLNKTSDNNYIVATYKRFNSGNLSNPRIIKIDSVGNTIWDSIYFQPSFGTILYCVKESYDGNFVATGTQGDSINNLQGLIMKVDQNGQLIWKRNVNQYNTPTIINELYDFDFTNNNSIVCAGYAGPPPPYTASQDIWVIKLDEWGCDSLGCQFTVVEELEKESEEFLLVYPNPAQYQIALEYRFTQENTFLTLYDLSGRQLKSMLISNAEGKMLLDISEIPNGMYFLQVRKGQEILQSKKLIIAK